MPRRTAILVALIGILIGAAPVWAEEKRSERIVFVGDSITDGNTYPLLIRQALSEAGKPVPVCINAGVASDTAALVRKRLERDVIAHKPTLVTLSIGVNDGLHKVKPEDYEADVTAILERLRQDKIPVLILTTTVLGPKHTEAEKRLEEYNAILRRLADKHGCKVAEVFKGMSAAREAGTKVLEPDAVHLSYEGYKVMARAVLDGIGFKDVALPTEFKVELMPGVIREWKIRPTGEKEPALDEKSVAAVKPDDSWQSYSLPEQDVQEHWWMEQERKRGFAVSLGKKIGAGKGYIGITNMESAKPRTVYFNTGSDLRTIWVNGKRIYKNESWTGWHAGKERIAAELQTGTNTIVIESGGQFFLSVTDSNDW